MPRRQPSQSESQLIGILDHGGPGFFKRHTALTDSYRAKIDRRSYLTHGSKIPLL